MDPFTKRGADAQSARRHADFVQRCAREDREREDARKDLLAWARRHNYAIRYRSDGLGGLIPYAVRPGSPDGADGFTEVPGAVRR